MGWKECSQVDEKLKFIARLIEGEKMAPLCREFGISRKTGHKLWNRYKDMGNEALIEQKRTPYRYANKIPLQIEALILETKKEFPSIFSSIVTGSATQYLEIFAPDGNFSNHSALGSMHVI